MAHTHTQAGRRGELAIGRLLYSANRDASDAPPPGSQLPYISSQRHNIFTTLDSGFSGFPIGAAKVVSGVFLGRSNERDSETSQASYGHPGCDLSFVRLVRLSLSLPVVGRLSLFPNPRDNKAATPYYAHSVIPSPRVYCGGIPALHHRCQTADDRLPRSPSILSHCDPARALGRADTGSGAGFEAY